MQPVSYIKWTSWRIEYILAIMKPSTILLNYQLFLNSLTMLLLNNVLPLKLCINNLNNCWKKSSQLEIFSIMRSWKVKRMTTCLWILYLWFSSLKSLSRDGTIIRLKTKPIQAKKTRKGTKFMTPSITAVLVIWWRLSSRKCPMKRKPSCVEVVYFRLGVYSMVEPVVSSDRHPTWWQLMDRAKRLNIKCQY